MTAFAIAAGLGLGLAAAYASHEARLAFVAWLAWKREETKPAGAPAPADGAVVERLAAVEGELARMKVERLTGRR